MKRFVKLALILFAAVNAMFCCIGINAYAEDNAELTYTEEISGQVNEILEDYDIIYSFEDMETLSLENVSEGIKSALESRIYAPFKLLGILLVLIVFTSFIRTLGETRLSNSGVDMFGIVCIVSAVTVISEPLLASFDYAASAMERGGSFMLLFVPMFAGISFFSGGLTTVSAYNVIAIGAAELLVQISQNILMPLVGVTASLSIINSIYAKNSFDSIIKLIQKLVTWSLTVLTTLVTGFITIKSTISTAADGVASKTVKFMISGFVPVIGSAVSDAYSTVKGSISLVKCTTGTAGILAVVLILLPPLIELFSFRFVMWIGTTAAEMFSVQPIAKLLKSLDAGLSIAISMIICFSLLFIISTAILMKSVNNV